MDIAVIGAGNVGQTLAKGWTKAGHQVIFGLRDVAQVRKRKDLSEINGVPLLSIPDAVVQVEVWVLAFLAKALSVPGQLTAVEEK
ncbi:MAG TPA: NAD(P)-binding domain-containing protein [Edaphocola sp.]|nr:NAD(P)-binding domain-containing protein [Edaphocola sp.]